MKKAFFVFVALISTIATAHADFVKGSQTLALFGGAGGSSDRYDFRGPDDRPVSGGGGAWGAQYLYYVTAFPAIAFGADLNRSYNGNFHSDHLIGNTNTTARLKSTIGMLIARLSFPRGRWRPYLFGGVGVHHSSLFLSGQPAPGDSWPDGGADSRVLIDRHQTSVAVGYGVGLDAFVSETIFVGVELRGTVLGGLKPEETAAARSAGLSLRHDTIPSQGNIFFRLGYKFGM
jgi:opacity protein-like surface antigen